MTVKADLLSENGDYKKAIELYQYAKNIYFNRYRDNRKNVDGFSYHLAQSAKAAYQNKDYKNYQIFTKELVNLFGKDHVRSKEILALQAYEAKL